MPIYTGGGDKGETSLASGKRVKKNDVRIIACGEIDELNALLGICFADIKASLHKKILLFLQSKLFEIGSIVAESKIQLSIEKSDIQQIEKWIDQIERKNTPLKNFILPGGSHTASFLHLARTVCRRAERSLVGIEIPINIKIFINRISDLLFVMARQENNKNGEKECIWKKV